MQSVQLSGQQTKHVHEGKKSDYVWGNEMRSLAYSDLGSTKVFI